MPHSDDLRAPAAPSPARRAGRRLSGWVALLPLALAGAYALGHAVLRGSPSLRDMVPPDAVEVQRYRDLATYDALYGDGSDPADPVRASTDLASRINLFPGGGASPLPGVDRGRPLLQVSLDPANRPQTAFFVLPVADRALVERTHRDPDLPRRHAIWVEVHGDWAAAAWDRDAVEHAGKGGGIWAEERGEDWCRFARWKPLVDLVLRQAGDAPFRGMFEALGADPSAAKPEKTTEGAVQWSFPLGRAHAVREAWSFVALYGWADRIRAELTPEPGNPIAKALADAASLPRSSTANPGIPAPAEGAEAWLSVRDGAARRALALALEGAGVAWPDALIEAKYAALRPDSPGETLAWAELSPGALPYWTIAIAGARDDLPDLAPFGLPPPPAEGAAPIAGLAPALTRPYGGEPSPVTIARRAGASGDVDVVAFGLAAPTILDRAAAGPRFHAARAGGPESTKAAGTPPLARFRLSVQAAQRLLSKAVSRGGILSPLQGGDIEGEVTTDGTRLILEARRVR